MTNYMIDPMADPMTNPHIKTKTMTFITNKKRDEKSDFRAVSHSCNVFPHFLRTEILLRLEMTPQRWHWHLMMAKFSAK